jgi:hypothetical protein
LRAQRDHHDDQPDREYEGGDGEKTPEPHKGRYVTGAAFASGR